MSNWGMSEALTILPEQKEEATVVCPCCGVLMTEREARHVGLYKDTDGKWYEPWEKYLARTGQND